MRAKRLKCRLRSKNEEKGMAFRWAIVRIDEALRACFFLEAIALEETVMADRLWSYFEGKSADQRRGGQTSAKRLAKAIGKLNLSLQSAGIAGAIANWCDDRDWALHAAVKSRPGGPPLTTEAFLSRAEEVALAGRLLMRRVLRWHRQELAAFRREASLNESRERASRPAAAGRA